MTNAEINKKFLATVDAKFKDMISRPSPSITGSPPPKCTTNWLTRTRKTFWTSMTGPERTAAYALYQRHGFNRKGNTMNQARASEALKFYATRRSFWKLPAR